MSFITCLTLQALLRCGSLTLALLALSRQTLQCIAVVMGLMLQPWTAYAGDFLDPELAFKLSVKPAGTEQLEIRFDVAPGYHLYRDKLKVEASTANAIQALSIPRGVLNFDTNFNKEVEVFKAPVSLALTLGPASAAPFKLTVHHQGCAVEGLCYPPSETAFKVERQGTALAVSALTEAEMASWPSERVEIESTRNTLSPSSPSSPSTPAPLAEKSDIASALESGSLLSVMGVFWIAGLLLSFTPCVLPMVPILSSIIVGQSGEVSRTKGFTLALAYSLGMALIYTALGMAAGLAGEGLAAALQNPWVLGGFAVLLAVLSLSMFGAYELQIPTRIQGRLTEFSSKLKGGQYAGVFVMGGLSALIVGPCVAAPLAGALVYISQTKDMLIGGTALFALACGMSVPLLLVGVSAGSLLPKAGGWMNRVKHLFGALLLAVALWMVSPVTPAWALMVGVAALLMATAVYLGAFDRLDLSISPAQALIKGVGLMLALGAAMQLVGAASGGRDLLQPLQHWGQASGSAGLTAGGTTASSAHLAFQTVTTVEALETAIRAAPKPVMLDFYADWCVACKELDAFTFSDPEVRQRMQALTLLRVDVTANNADDKALMRKFQLFGPPALLFFDLDGRELAQARVIGFQNAKKFAAHLDSLAAARANPK